MAPNIGRVVILLLHKETFCLYGCLAAGASSADSLAIDGVGNVTSYKDAGKFGAWCAVDFLEVAHLIGI